MESGHSRLYSGVSDSEAHQISFSVLEFFTLAATGGRCVSDSDAAEYGNISVLVGETGNLRFGTGKNQRLEFTDHFVEPVCCDFC